ncbi:MAG: IS4 family transposase [Pseudomonadota bacterium]
MNQSNNFSGKPIISQLLKFIPRDIVYRTATRHHSDRYVKTFKTYDHLITLLYSVLSDCTSLRELSTAMLACEGKLNHLGIDYFPKRSTLADANIRRSHEVFADIYYSLLNNYRSLLSDSCRTKDAPVSKLFIADSSTVQLFSDVVLKGAGRNPLNGKKKGGMKIHTLMQSNEDVPCLINLTSAATHDHHFLSQINLPKHSWLVFDKGYTDYHYYQTLTAKEIFFVTRQRENAVYDCIEEFDIAHDAPNGLLKDEHIHIIKDNLNLCLRHVAWWDENKNKCFEFITNNFTVPAQTIAAVYKQRWQIELLFKRLKQNF